MKIEYKNLVELIPYEFNAKLHPESQLFRITRSIQEFGFRNPVLIDEKDEIVAGHGRCLAAREAGMTEVPVIRVEDLTPEQVRAYRIADNKLAEGEFYEDLLKGEVQELEGQGIELEDLVDLPLELEQQNEADAKSSKQTVCPFCGHVF